MNYPVAFLVCATLALGNLARAATTNFKPEQIEFFEKRIRPLLVEQCYSCHSTQAKKLKGNLHLDSREAMLKGGDSGPAIVPGNVEKSLLIESVLYANQDLQMPPKSKLPDAQIADLKEWIKQGAPWPDEGGAKTTAVKKFDLAKRKAEFWCWEPLKTTPLPKVKDKTWGAQAIDRYILARLEEKKLTPAKPAEAHVLLRRLSFDITGLPPKADEIAAFEKAFATNQQAAIEGVVDRFLASSQFGERWGRHWLDSVRYAETRGHEFDYQIPNAYQYRDYVVRALNADVPYNQFVREHIAGDLLPSPRLNPQTGADESIIGTGFWFLGEEVHSPVNIRGDEADRMDNRLDMMTKTFLGLTVGCARCHDHKFDAISQRDYSALTGFLISSGYRQARFGSLEAHRVIADELNKVGQKAAPDLVKAAGEALPQGISQAPKYLMAAREVLQDEKADIAAIANARNVEVAQLKLWADELKAAKTDAAHPLNAFAAVTLDLKSDDTAEFARRLTDLLTRWKKQGAEAQNAPPIAAENIIVDYAKSGPDEWFQDGYSFGLRPVKQGEPIVGISPEKPLLGFVTRTGAQRGEAWKNLAVQGADRDVGGLGGWERSEQTLRTRDFTLKASNLWYLVRGPLRAYAAVDSHLIVQGPLHGALLREVKDENNEWRWVQHNLGDYKGHRLHVEFSPIDKADLSVAMVVQADGKPPLPDAPDELLLSALSNEKVQSPQALAEALTEVWRIIAAQMVAGTLKPEAIKIADGLLREQDLFVPPGSESRRNFVVAAQPFFKEQAQITARIQTNSPTAPAMMDGNGVNEFLLIRGQANSPGEVVPRRFLEALAGTNTPNYHGSGRDELAKQITDPSNPFTSRVMVNRVWHHLFGRGIVPTVDNFGVLGQPPSHRELLDYLALRFANEQNWSVKKLIREIVLSRAYQMSSARADDRTEEADPQNILLHRANVKRLEGEAIRDAILAVSGRLDLKIGGPSVPVYLTQFMDGRGRPSSGPLDGAGRRSLYIAVRRNFLQPMLLTFDMPIPFASIGRRNVSNVPAQALILMNDPFVVDQTKVWAKNSAKFAEPKERVGQMYLTALGRMPSEKEQSAALSFIEEQAKLLGTDANNESVWADLGHVLFNVKEFIYLR